MYIDIIVYSVYSGIQEVQIMNITYIIIFLIGIVTGFIISLIIWLKQLSDDSTKFDIEICKLQADLEILKELTYESKN